MSSITITLSAGDLEKILVEDGEVKVAIGEQIADAFAKKYLKSVVHSKFAQMTQSVSEKAAHEVWDGYVGRPMSNTGKIADVLKRRITMEIEANLARHIGDTIQERIAQAAEKVIAKYSDDKLREEIDYRVTKNVQLRIEEGVRAAMSKALKEVLK